MAATVPAGLPGAGANVANTADVAAARAAFFATYQKEFAAATGQQAPAQAPRHQHWSPAPVFQSAPAPLRTPVSAPWTGPMAATVPAGLPGSGPVVAETAAVVAAKNAFARAYSAAVTATTGRRF